MLIGAAVIEGVAMLAWLRDDGLSAAWLVVTVALVLSLMAVYALAGALTVAVDHQRVRIALGVGLLRRSISLAEIEDCRPVRNRWWYGWGIRLTPRGWLWNVSGLDAVELTYRSGKHFRIGTDESSRLCEAIKAAGRHV